MVRLASSHSLLILNSSLASPPSTNATWATKHGFVVNDTLAKPFHFTSSLVWDCSKCQKIVLYFALSSTVSPSSSPSAAQAARIL
ncbi:hypothetical protein GBA52_007532 [Prunus armeniaca]|nr:hypothetical protein GBA52_007532 [Prunus armeniaca]